jgi:hypothetical protein
MALPPQARAAREKTMPALDEPDQPLSTQGRQSGILMHVHSIPPNKVGAW